MNGPRSLPLFLASRSPQRQRLLAAWGWEAEVIPPGTEQVDPGCCPEEEALRRARAKCLGATLGQDQAGIILGADTLGVTGAGKILGKPADRAVAQETLETLSGTCHRVISGVWAVDTTGGNGRGGVDVSTVHFRSLSAREITDYLDSGEWEGKAGAYGIQGLAAAFVSRVIGEVDNVVGLPRGLTGWLLEMLEREWLERPC